jgi:PIN domain nuclease of toxin-antitoxin system
VTIVLDTHVWYYWLTDPKRLRSPMRRVIERAVTDDRVAVSVVSCWEIALKNSLGKLPLPLPAPAWIARALDDWPTIRVEPLSLEDAVASTQLAGELHRDPADRFIVALTLRLGAKLATHDAALVAYPHLKTL